MSTHKTFSIATFVACGCTCLAYEAIRISGWYNRFPSWNTSFNEIALSQWSPYNLFVYLSLFLPFVVVAFNKNNPKIKLGWLLLSFLIFAIACMKIPSARHGRWAGTHDHFILIYWLVVPLLSIIFILIGRYADRTVNGDA